MKSKITLFVVLMFAGIITIQAQPGQRRTAEERTKLTVNRLADSLKLSAAQRTDVDVVYLEFYKGQDKLREVLAPGTRPAKADLDKVAEIRDAKLKVILNEEQFARFQAIEAAMRNRGQRPQAQ